MKGNTSVVNASGVKKYYHKLLFDEKEITFTNKTFGLDRSACNVCPLRKNCDARNQVNMWIACENVNRADILLLKQNGETAIFLARTLVLATSADVEGYENKVIVNKDIQSSLLEILDVLNKIPIERIEQIFNQYN